MLNIIHNETNYDVIITGAGPSGVSAAISAGRNGAKVLLIEQENCLGGMWTSGYMNPLFDYKRKDGLLIEIIKKLKEMDAWGGMWNASFNFETMKFILEEMCLDANVNILYETRYIGCDTKDKEIKEIYVSNIEGITSYKAKYFIDASGDAMLASDAGVKCFVGEDDDYKTCQAMTLMFLVSGVPEKYKEGKIIFDAVEEAFKKEGKGNSLNFDKPFIIPAPGKDFANVQLTHMKGYNPLSQKERTEAIIEGRNQLMKVFKALKEYDDDFKNLSLISSAPLLGVRESRRIDGEYTITEDDLMNGTKFDDGITTVTFNVDIHSSSGDKQDCRKITPYQIPFRSMIPKRFNNLLVCGRCISGTHIAMASYRVTGNCSSMGEACGKAVAYAAKNNTEIRSVPTEVYCKPYAESALYES